MFERGKIVLVPFPFTDLSAQKVRPALIVSALVPSSADIIVAFISTVIIHRTPADVLIARGNGSFQKTGLKFASIIRCDKLATLDKRIVLGELGALDSSLLHAVNRGLRRALGLRTH